MHKFHKDCIDKWLLENNTCPVDKKDLKKLIKENQDFNGWVTIYILTKLCFISNLIFKWFKIYINFECYN